MQLVCLICCNLHTFVGGRIGFERFDLCKIIEILQLWLLLFKKEQSHQLLLASKNEKERDQIEPFQVSGNNFIESNPKTPIMSKLCVDKIICIFGGTYLTSPAETL